MLHNEKINIFCEKTGFMSFNNERLLKLRNILFYK